MAYQNAAGINVTGIVTLSSAGVPTGSTVTNHGVVTAGANNTVTSVAPGTSGNLLTSNGTDWASAAPAASSITITGNTGGGLTGNSFTFSGGTTGLSFGGSGSTETLSGTVVLANGGTSASLTASNGGIFYSTSSAGAILSGTATAGQIIRSGSSSAPSWSTATYPATAGTSGNVLTSDGTNFVSSAPAASSISLTGDSGGALTGASFTIKTASATQNSGATFSVAGASSTLTFNITDASGNTLVGNSCGNGTYTGTQNTGFGPNVLKALTDGTQNVGFGRGAFELLTGGDHNVAMGTGSLQGLLTGDYNCCLGHISGNNYASTESNNILLNNAGTASESNVLRIGSGTGTSTQQLNKAIICGINGITVTGTAVLVSSSDQLGIAVSSAKFKDDIVDMKDTTEIVKSLRPVNFRWKKESFSNSLDYTEEVQYGLISEEVHKSFPYLCAYDKKGEPFSVKYDQLPAILLNQIKIMQKQIDDLTQKTNKLLGII